MGDVDRVLDGDLEALIHAYLVWRKTGKTAGDTGDRVTVERAEIEAGRGAAAGRQAGRIPHRDRLRAGRERAR